MNVFGYKRSDKAVKFKIGGVFFIRKVRFIFYFLNFVRQMLIEKQILSDLKKSDRSAFQSLFRYYYPRLKAYAATMVDDSVAEDLVQDLFLYVWEHREDLIMGASFHSYLFQGIYSRCVDYFRKYASCDSCDMEVYEEYLTEQAAFLQNDDDAWEELYAKDFYQQLYELLKEIPQQRREVFFLAYLSGKKTKEIAEQLDMPVRTVESHLHLTLKFLKKHLSKKDFFLVLSALSAI